MQNTNLDESTPKDKEGMSQIKDDSPNTFLNENLWNAFAFHLLAYIAPIIFGSIIIVGDFVTGFNMGKFFFGIMVIVIPLFSATSRAQANNKRNQALLKKEEKQALVSEEYEKKIAKMDEDKQVLENTMLDQKLALVKAETESRVIKDSLDSISRTNEANAKALESATNKIAFMQTQAPFKTVDVKTEALTGV